MKTVIEASRGCGYRKPGKLYLRLDGTGTPCGVFPIKLDVCPCCNQGVKPTRGFTWIQARLIQGECTTPPAGVCLGCGPMKFDPETPVGLIWIGKKFYSTPEAFLREADKMGISRAIPALPKDFDIGKTWVALAMRDVSTGLIITNEDNLPEPETENRVFTIFRPSRVEYVVTGKETPEELERLEKRGITPIRVIRDIDNELFNDETNKTDYASKEEE